MKKKVTEFTVEQLLQNSLIDFSLLHKKEEMFKSLQDGSYEIVKYPIIDPETGEIVKKQDGKSAKLKYLINELAKQREKEAVEKPKLKMDKVEYYAERLFNENERLNKAIKALDELESANVVTASESEEIEKLLWDTYYPSTHES